MKFIVYKDRKGEWRWSLVARNGRKVADSGEGYKSRAHTKRMALRVVELSRLTPIVEQ